MYTQKDKGLASLVGELMNNICCNGREECMEAGMVCYVQAPGESNIFCPGFRTADPAVGRRINKLVNLYSAHGPAKNVPS